MKAVKVTETITASTTHHTVFISEYQDALLASRVSLPVEDLPRLIAALELLWRHAQKDN